MLKVGDKAPGFRLASTAGADATLEGAKNKKLVLYFYPKDDTPGCTREACDFRDNLARLSRTGVEVLGVSKDSLEVHGRFRGKYDLPFHLLSDPDNAIAKAYGAFGEKNMYGKKILGTIRSTFVIDEGGRIEAMWSPVRVDGHVDQVLAHLSGEPKPTAKKKVKARAKKTATKNESAKKAAKKKSRKSSKKK